MAAPVLSAYQQAAITRMADAARARDLRIIGRGFCKVAPFTGARVFAVQSATRPDRTHLVWIAKGRLLCSCEARKNPHIFTCSHAQAVRLALMAEAAEPRSIPSPSSPDRRHEPDHEPQPPAPRGGIPCPTCGVTTDADEIEQLGECVECVMEAARQEERRPMLCACGSIATGEALDGFICDECAAQREAARRAEVARRKAEEEKAAAKAEAAERIIAREDARQKRIAQERRRAATGKAKARADAAAEQHARPTRARTATKKAPAAKPASRENPNPAPSPAPVTRDDMIWRTKTHAGRA